MSYQSTWTVSAGESLSTIAQKFALCPPAGASGMTRSQVAEQCLVAAQGIAVENGISNPNLIYPGQVLRITVPDGPDRLSVEDVPVAAKSLAPRIAGASSVFLLVLGALLLVRKK